jgi:hypothetical protein
MPTTTTTTKQDCTTCHRQECQTRRKDHPFEACQRWMDIDAAVDACALPAKAGVPKRGAPVAVLGTWDSARTWLDRMRAFELGKICCQIMLGFELLEIQRKQGPQPGKRSDLLDNSANSASAATSSRVWRRWQNVIEEELHIPQSSGYVAMAMARAAAPRIRRAEGLGGFDLTERPISELPAVKQKLLLAVVRKISDVKSQAEFFQRMGIYKGLGGKNGGRKPGDGGRPAGPATLEQVRAARLARFREDLPKACKVLATIGTAFLLAEDADAAACQGFIALLDRQSSAMKSWFNSPTLKRDAVLAKKIEGMFK